MATGTGATPERGATTPGTAAGETAVDPRAPRLGNLLTATGLLGGVLLGHPAPVAAVAVVLCAAALSGWRLDLYALVWRRVVRPLVGPGGEPEAAAPHRFAKLVGAVGSALATVLLAAGLALPGYAVAGTIGLVAALSGTTGFCVGCRLYRQVSLFRRLGVV